MLACVTLLDYGSKMRLWGKTFGFKDMMKKSCPRPWIAEYPNDGERKFIKGFTDHGNSNSDGSRPVEVRFMVEVGKTYEVFEPMPKGGGRRIICKVTQDGKISEVA
jgi:hypothetical protein